MLHQCHSLYEQRDGSGLRQKRQDGEKVETNFLVQMWGSALPNEQKWGASTLAVGTILSTISSISSIFFYV